MPDWLAAFLKTLRDRGIVFDLQGDRLRIRPWKNVSVEEAGLINSFRPDLKALIRAEAATPIPPVDTTPAPTPAPEADPVPAICSYCGEACKIDSDVAVYAWRHRDDPKELDRRARLANQAFYARRY
jgi:hypothetical protein